MEKSCPLGGPSVMPRHTAWPVYGYYKQCSSVPSCVYIPCAHISLGLVSSWHHCTSCSNYSGLSSGICLFHFLISCESLLNVIFSVSLLLTTLYLFTCYIIYLLFCLSLLLVSKLCEGRDLCFFCSLIHSWHLEHCLEHSRCSTNTC